MEIILLHDCSLLQPDWFAVITPVISAIATALISYVIYHRTSNENKRNVYFKEITMLYYQIDEAHLLMKKEEEVGNVTNADYHKNRIKIFCTILLNYVKKYPSPKNDIKELENVLLNIIVNPTWDQDYIELMEKMQSFCWTIDLKATQRHNFQVTNN